MKDDNNYLELIMKEINETNKILNETNKLLKGIK